MANTEEIIKELMEFEPELKKYKKELSMIVKAMIEAKPDTKFNQKFAQNLRAKLISNLSYTKPTISNFFFMKKLSYILSGVVLTLVVASAGYFGTNFYKENMQSQKKLVSFAPNIIEVGDSAFGKLNTTAGTEMGGGGEMGMGGGGQGNTDVSSASGDDDLKTSEGGSEETGSAGLISPSDNPAVAENTSSLDKVISFNATGESPTKARTDSSVAEATGSEEAVVPSPDDIIEPYPYTVYKYIYTGTDFTVDDEKVTVLKRTDEKKPDIDVLGLLEKFSVSNFININNLKETYLEYLTVSEDRDFGYSLYINLLDGTLSFSQNYRTWPQSSCFEGSCSPSLKIEDVPEDAEIIKIANNFLKEYGVDLSKSYSDPIVNKYFEADYKVAIEEGWEPYIPDDVSITYPLKINGLETYYDGGDKTGVNVNVNMRYDKVSSVWDLNTLNYESSKYDAINKDMVTKVMEKGGLNNYLYYYEPLPTDNVKEVEIKLGTPIKGYMRYWNYADGSNDEMLIEALIFPVVENPADEAYFYQKAVVVPLTKDVYETANPPLRVLE